MPIGYLKAVVFIRASLAERGAHGAVFDCYLCTLPEPSPPASFSTSLTDTLL